MQHTRKRAGLLKSALLGAATLGALSLAGAGVAQAAPIDWLFYNTAQNPGIVANSLVTSETFNSDQGLQPLPVGITAWQHIPTNTNYTTTFVNNKDAGSNEMGLGLTVVSTVGPDSQREIVPNSFVQIDISNLYDPPLSQLTLTLQGNSVTGTDGYRVYATNTAGGSISDLTTDATLVYGSTVTSGVDITTNTDILKSGGLGQNFKYIDVTATSGNILLKKLDSTISNAALVPEPGSLALLGTGLVGLGLVARRRRRKA